MKNNIFKKIFSICFIMFLFFSVTESVSAGNFFDLQKKQSSVFNKCPYSQGCMAVCIYNTNTAGSGEEVGLVGYYNTDGNKWVIAFRGDESHNSGAYDIYYSQNDERLVHGDDVYDGNHHERVDWKEQADLYTKLKDNFECPSRMYIDKNASSLARYNELCFEGTGGNCGNFNRASTTFVPAYLSYSFVDEYKSVMTDAYDKLSSKFTDDNEELNKEKVKFLSLLIPDVFQYVDSHSAKENAALNCTNLKNVADEKYQPFLESISGNQEYFQRYVDNYINPTIKSVATDKSVKYPNLYVYSNLINLVGFKNLALYSGPNASNGDAKPLIEMFSSTAYNRNIKEAISFISNTCNDIGSVTIDMRVDTDGDGIIDSDNMNDIVNTNRVSFDIKKFTKPGIEGLDNPDNLTYDCGFLSDIADIISTAYFIIEMVGLAILIVFTAMDYIKIFLNDNADELKKANSNFLKRLIIAVLLFLLPALVNFTLRIFNIEGINSEHPLCVQISNK